MRSMLPIIVCFMLSSAFVRAQNTAIWAGGGIQFSTMDDMKYLQDEILGTYPIPGKVTSSFPAYTMGSLGFVNQWYPQVRIGAGYSFSATGGKSNYSDYSGYVTTMINAASHRVGGFASYSILAEEWFELTTFGRIQLNYTMIDISSHIYALGASSYNDNSYSSFSPGGSAGLEFLVHLKDFSIGAEGAYEVDIPGQLSKVEDKVELTDPNDYTRVLTSDWSGWYVQLKFLIWLDF